MTTTDSEVKSVPTWAKVVWLLLAISLILVPILMSTCSGDDDTTSARNNPPPAPDVVEPIKVRATTPATITADYGFSLEADGPIMVQYPGEKAFLFDPRLHGGCQQLPQPRNSGPKKFWDPSNPENGHISFRIYRGRGVC